MAESDLSPAGKSIQGVVQEAFSFGEKSLGEAAVIDPMIDMTETGTVELGYEFTLAFPVTITELGLYDLSGDGFTEETPVTIWSVTDQSAVITANIPAGTETTIINGFRYINIPDSRLETGTYRISAYITNDEYGMNSGFTAQTCTGITINAGIYNINHEYPINYNNSVGFFGPNFMFAADKPAVIDPLISSEGSGTWEIGCSFIVYSSILVTALGTYDSNGDGLTVETPVTIWRVSDESVVATTNIPAADTAVLINNFRYMPIDSVYLEPGIYRMSSYFTGETFARNTVQSSIFSSEIYLLQGVYSSSHGYPATVNSSFYFGANFLFTNPLAAVTDPLIDGSSSGTWELGYEFEVTNTITLTDLGTFDYNGDGIVQTIVTLWNPTDQTSIISDTIPSGTDAILIDGFRYIDVPDLTLYPGTYRISSYFVSDYYGWNPSANSTALSEINILEGVYKPFNLSGYPEGTDTYYYFGPNFLVRSSCQVSDLPVIDGSSLLCSGDSTLLVIASGDLNNSAYWHWYSDSCGGNSLDINDSLIVRPASSTTYYIRGEGNCTEDGPGAMFTVNVVNSVSVSREQNTLIADIEGVEYQWLDCNNSNAPISGANEQIFYPDEDGDYAVRVTINDCELESNCRHFTLTGLIQNTFSDGLLVHPNPVRDMLSIEIPETDEQTTFEVINLSGRVLLRESHNWIPEFKIDLEAYDAGLYLLRVYTDDKSALIKIFKE